MEGLVRRKNAGMVGKKGIDILENIYYHILMLKDLLNQTPEQRASYKTKAQENRAKVIASPPYQLSRLAKKKISIEETIKQYQTKLSEIQNEINEVLKQMGLQPSIPQVTIRANSASDQIIRYLTNLGPQTSADLSRNLGKAYSNVFVTLKKLESKGIIEQDEDKKWKVLSKENVS